MPAAGVLAVCPLHIALQVRFVPVVVTVNAVGSVMVTDAFALHPLASVVVTI